MTLAGHALRSYRAGGEFVANREMVFGERVIAAGSRLPWRELGLHEVQVHHFWRANLVDSLPAPPPPLAAPAVSPPVTVQRAEEPASRRRR